MAYNIHDLTFKKLLSSHIVFKEFCEKHLPASVNKRIHWHSAKLLKLNNERVSAKAKKKNRVRMADITYQVDYDGPKSDSLIICVEHQSSADKLMSLRCLHYMTGQMLDFAKNNRDKKSPSIINIVFYHGKKTPWPYSMNVLDLFADPEFMKDHFLSPVLVDVSQISDDEFNDHKNLLAPIEYLFKHVYKGKFSHAKTLRLANLLRSALGAHKYQSQAEVDEIVEVMLNYGLEQSECEPEAYINTLTKKLTDYQEMMMKGGQILINKGFELGFNKGVSQGFNDGMSQGISQGINQGINKGISQGKLATKKQIALNFLASGIAPELVAKHCDLSMFEINQLLREVAEKNPH